MSNSRPDGSSSETVPAAPARGLSRRRLVAGAGALGVAGAAAGFFTGRATAEPGEAGEILDLSRRYEFYTGGHQAGIATLPQRYCVFMTFDVTAVTAEAVKVLLARWSAAIAQLMAGLPVGSIEPTRSGAVAADTGEALDLAPSGLTVTLGLGPGLFDERFGLADRRPRLLEDLPELPSDQLRPPLTGGDLSLQACADDPQVAYHAIRDLARMARGSANTRWVVLGFGRASAGSGQTTPRNLLGFKDGTRNLTSAGELDEHVWLGDGTDVDWMTGGTYQVVRKIRMDIEIWDADDITDQQGIFARKKISGAPLTGKSEFDTPDFSATDASGDLVIDPTSHVALAAHENNDGIKILRRSYNFTDGINDLGQLDAGLLFVSYQRTPASFIALQRRLGASDRLNEYIAHVGSGIFAVPPAPTKGHFLAEDMFA
ncbi:MAG: iron uptake transporter deferrochelatase/peroxidase subunit [Nocardioides sp.]|uniref:iron uptake transporter deferrochelatase/peroxidase subunit n=1 Tax=Nocardioides sp. TaxID=35761 RepID=UPI0039E299B8